MLSQQQQTLIIQPKNHTLSCQQSNKATFLCANPSCQNNTFVCSQQNCKCKTQHDACLLVQPSRLTKKIEQKLIDGKGIKQYIDKIVDNCIDWISDWRQRLIDDLKYYGLTEIQKQYISAVRSNESNKINGKIMFDIVQKINLQNNIPKVQEAVKSIDIYWKNKKGQIYQLFHEIQNMVSKSKTTTLTVESLISNIVDQKQDFKTLVSFFNKKIIGFKLLYRASMNQFAVFKFYSNCANIPNTLILVQTDYNKIIGGFTPLCWKMSNKQQNFADSSKQSFIFSLTNGDKFELIEPSKAIQYYGMDCGPRFGGITSASDLTIKDKANENPVSYSLFNNCYYNKNYERNHTQSYRKFIGGESNFFKIKQWQVFEVKFE